MSDDEASSTQAELVAVTYIMKEYKDVHSENGILIMILNVPLTY